MQEGKLRILQYDSSHGMSHTTSAFLDENMLEVQKALNEIMPFLRVFVFKVALQIKINYSSLTCLITFLNCSFS